MIYFRQSLLDSDSCNKLQPLDLRPPTAGHRCHIHNLDTFEIDSNIRGMSNRGYKYSNASNTFNPNANSLMTNAGVYNLEVASNQRTPSPASSSNTDNSRMYENNLKENKVKMEHSQLMLEIRNSAPDVIIMTSQ